MITNARVESEGRVVQSILGTLLVSGLVLSSEDCKLIRNSIHDIGKNIGTIENREMELSIAVREGKRVIWLILEML